MVHSVVECCFRGQSRRDWPLVSSLTRLIREPVDDREVLDIEERLVESFAKTAHLYLPASLAEIEIYDKPTWWIVMQHYGAPTRLLDWTGSPFVAAYFAVEDRRHWDADGSIWYFNITFMRDTTREKFGTELALELAPFRGGGNTAADLERVLPLRGVETVSLVREMDRAAVQQSCSLWRPILARITGRKLSRVVLGNQQAEQSWLVRL